MVVIGDGASAIDISVEISDKAKQVHLSSRKPDVQPSKLDCRDNMWQHSKVIIKLNFIHSLTAFLLKFIFLSVFLCSLEL